MIKKLLPHICIILAVSLLTFLVIDQMNSAMAFIDNQGTKVTMMVFCVLTILLAVLFVRELRKK